MTNLAQSVGSSNPTYLTGGQTLAQTTPDARARAIIAGATSGRVVDMARVDAKIAEIRNPTEQSQVRRAVEARLSPTQVGELRRASDHRTAVAAGRPEIITRPDGTKTDGFGVRISGTEPRYDPARWNTGDNTRTQAFNNCYAYAVNDLSASRSSKPQPGQRANQPMNYFNARNEIDIPRLQAAIAADGRTQGITWLGNTPASTLNAPKGSYIVALVVDNRDGVQDYHWYRHDADGSWSGKGGGGPATNLDGSGNRILDPRTANRFVQDYGSRGQLNYTTFVGYYAVTPGAQVGPSR
jgi:hypothetical protein